jgi:hypothetical protein
MSSGIEAKLHGDWSASSGAAQLSAVRIDDLIKRWQIMDRMVKARLLLSPLFLRMAELRELQPALQRLATAAAGDADDWVRSTAAAVGSYDGCLHADALIKESKEVQRTLEDLRERLQAVDPDLFRPLEVGRRVCPFCCRDEYIDPAFP